MRANSILCLVVVSFLLLTPRLVFAGGPENAIVVINADSDASKLIGNFYVTHRNIPAQNVVYLNDIPNRDIIGLPLCKTRILLPIAQYIKKQGLNQQIDYIIYSSDFPSKIDVFKQAKDFVIKRESMGISTNERLHLGGSSISSVTYFLSDILQNNNDFIALDANKYFRKRNIFTTEKVFNGIEQENFKDAVRKVELKKHDQASELLAALINRHPRQPALYYWAAKNSAGLGNIENCIRFLKAAVRHGFAWKEFIATDRAFKSIINDAAFEELLESVPPNTVSYLPTQHFDSNYLWGRNGFVNGDALHGESYVLSTILGVTRNKGNSEREVLDYLQRSIDADGSRPKGTFYFCDTSDVRNRTRRSHYDLAIEELQRLGHNAQIAKQVLPKKVDDIAGLMLGTPNFDFKKTGSQILPGAICENLTSYGGALQMSIGQTKFTELLRFGAAGSCGTVREPYAIENKFPHPNIHVHYARGCTLAESFYQAVQAPFQLLIGGDALCCPFADAPSFQISNRKSLKDPQTGTASIRLANDESGPAILRYELYVDGREHQQTTSNAFELDTAKFADGYHEIRVVAVANNVARNRSRIKFPLIINNKGLYCRATVTSVPKDWHGLVEVEVETNGVGSVALKQFDRALMRTPSKNGKAAFRVDARQLGRGPSSLSVEIKVDDSVVQSRPIPIDIPGKISTKIPVLPNKGIIHCENADHLVIVRNDRGQWQLASSRDDGPEWFEFEPAPADRLVAALNLTKDTARVIQTTSKFAGMNVGCRQTDLRIVPNRFMNRPNQAEFEIKGSYFFDENGRRVSIGAVRGGLAGAEALTGDAFVMYSEENIRNRFRSLRTPKKASTRFEYKTY